MCFVCYSCQGPLSSPAAWLSLCWDAVLACCDPTTVGTAPWPLALLSVRLCVLMKESVSGPRASAATAVWFGRLNSDICSLDLDIYVDNSALKTAARSVTTCSAALQALLLGCCYCWPTGAFAATVGLCRHVAYVQALTHPAAAGRVVRNLLQHWSSCSANSRPV